MKILSLGFFHSESSKSGILHLQYVSFWTRHIPNAQQPYVVDWCRLITKWCLFCNPMNVAHQAPLSMGFPKQEYWNGLPFPSPGDLPDPQGSNLHLLHWQVDSLALSHQGSPYVVSSSHNNITVIVIVKSLSRVRLFATPWTVAYQAPLSMGFSRQECWSRLPYI